MTCYAHFHNVVFAGLLAASKRFAETRSQLRYGAVSGDWGPSTNKQFCKAKSQSVYHSALLASFVWVLSGDAKSFDRVARKWNVDYAFYKTGSDKYLLFFKAGQADAMTACFSEYSRKVLSKAKSNRVPIREQLQQAADQLSKEKPKQKERAKEVAHEDR